jgi:hypothetical protein
MGGIGVVVEPLVVITFLFGGTWINRDFDAGRTRKRRPRHIRRILDEGRYGTPSERREREIDILIEDEDEDLESRAPSPNLLVTKEPKWRTRTVGVWGITRQVTTPNHRRFKGYFLSRLLETFPFLVECWYWALVYWVRLPATHLSSLSTNICTDIPTRPRSNNRFGC